jgi:hypothetical protein
MDTAAVTENKEEYSNSIGKYQLTELFVCLT